LAQEAFSFFREEGTPMSKEQQLLKAREAIKVLIAKRKKLADKK
jgi:hypothetical protein